jgi:cation transporter-like permease
MAVMLAVMIPALSGTAAAQTRYYGNRSRTTHVYKKPSFYRRHRNLSNILIGTGAGAIIGGLIGGRRGVGLGALVGAGGGALYTYKLNPKRPRYNRNY